jgi:hypothetical protein
MGGIGPASEAWVPTVPGSRTQIAGIGRLHRTLHPCCDSSSEKRKELTKDTTARLKEGPRLGAEHIELELTRVVDAPGVTHLRYRVAS